MPTVICKPTTLTQTTASSEVAWDLTNLPHSENDHTRGCSTQTPLTAVHGLDQLFGTQNTGVLTWSGYPDTNAVTNDGSTLATVTAISIRVYADKRNRCQDRTIKLTVNGSAVGNNLAKEDSGNDHTYTATVPAEQTTGNISRLGVQTQYKSGVMPHRDHMTVDTVHLIITYS